MIQFHHLHFRYHPKRPLFEGLNLQIRTPGIVGILGSNGAGKTTLLHILAGLRFPWSGECRVLHEEPARRKLAWQQQVLFVPETIEMPARELSFWLSTLTPFYPRFDRTLFDQIVQEFDLTPTGNLNELSFGQQKKLMLAFALATRVRILLLDEPSNGLDIFSKAQLRRIWTRYLPDNALVLVSTHQVRELGAQFDEVIILDQGQVLLHQSVAELSQRLVIRRSVEKPDATAWYQEPIPGGYLGLYLADLEGDETQLDLEILMKAILERPELLTHLTTTLAHV